MHHAYRRRSDRTWWRRQYPGARIPAWDHVSLCGRQGLVPVEGGQPVDCRACARILASRRRRLAATAGEP